MNVFYNFLFLLSCKVVCSNILTLKNNKSCVCVLTGEDVYSGAYLDPPKKDIKRSLDTLDIDFSNDWKSENVELFNFGPTTDQRWESFSDTNYLSLKKSESVSFSLYTNRTISLQVYTMHLHLSVKFDIPNSELKIYRWIHYTAKKENMGLKLYSQNGTLVDTVKMKSTPYAITTNSIMMRRHKYNITYSEDISPNESPTYNLYVEESKCLTMFVSIDNDCYLDIILKSYNYTYIYPQRGFNEKNFLKKWKRVEIRPNFFGNASLSFVRRLHRREKCFWAISQIYKCKKTDLFQIDNYQEGLNCSCKVLKDNDEPEEERWDNPGVLDTNINCSHILGEQYPFCENYQICSEDRCYCAWGFNGSSCTEHCQEGFWDVDCRSQCEKECKECDHKKGCIIKSNKGFTLPGSLSNTDVEETTTRDAVKIMETTSELTTTTDTIKIEVSNELSTLTNTTRIVKTFITHKEQNLTILSTPRIIVSSEKEIELHCSVINNSYTHFFIKIFKEETKGVIEEDEKVSSIKKEINFLIPVEYMKNYKITVVPKINQVETFGIKIYAIVLPPFKMFSLKPVVEVCIENEKCLLLIPPPHNHININNTSFFVTKDREIDTELLTRVYSLNKNKTVSEILKSEEWIVEPSVTASGIELEIGVSKGQAVSTKNQTYFIYLIFNTTKELVAYQITFKECESLSIGHIVLIVAALITLFSSGIAIFIRIQFWEKFYSPKTDFDKNIETIPLQSIQIEQDLTEDIDKEDFIHVLNQKLLQNSLYSEFSSIPMSHTKSSTHGQRDQNINKNKKKDGRIYFPYDYNRVILEEMDGLGTDDYINASYINGYDRPMAYIASPGPKFYTVKDFWRMIWQKEIKIIVMATNFIENQKRMSPEYWPQSLNAIYGCGELYIKLIKEENYEYYDSRILELQYRGSTKKIRHLHFKWNSEEPMCSNNLLPVVKKIRSAYTNGVSPILIHSGFGRSRTGILILCDVVLQKLKVKNKVNLYVVATNLIKQRYNIVKTPKDYILAHLTIAEFIMEKDSPFGSEVLKNIKPKVLTEQLKYLSLLNEHDKIIKSWKPQLTNKHYNFVDGYGQYRKYLVTRQPSGYDTAAQFWDMVANESISHIIFLEKFQENFCLWSHNTSRFSAVDINVEFVRFTPKEHWTVTELLLSFYIKGTKSKMKHKELVVYQFCECEISATDFVTHFISLICDINEKESDTPIVISCNDGVRLSGLFVVLSYVIKKYRKEGDIDVCNAIRTANRNGTNFINDTDQLKIIYHYISKFSEINMYCTIE